MSEHSPSRAELARPGPSMFASFASLDELEENRQKANALDIDIKAIWSALYRNRYIIATILVLALFLGVVTALLTTPIYRATASVQIDQQTTKVLETQDTEPSVTVQDAERFLQTQLDVIKSRSLAARVGDSLNLYRSNQFLTAMGASPGGVNGLDAREAQRERVVRVLEKNLTVELPRSSRIAKISFDSPDAALAARVANSFVQNYIASNLKRRFDTTAYTRNFLENQLTETKARLEDSERQMIAYARDARLIDTSGGSADGESRGGASLTTSNLIQLNNSYTAARAARVAAEQRWEAAQGSGLMNLPEVLSNTAITQLQQARAEANAQLEQDRTRYGAEYSALRQTRAKVQEIDRQIASLANSIKNSIREQYLVARRQEAALDTNVGQLQRDTLAEQDRSVRYNILKREVDTNRALYDGLLQRYKEVSAAAGITTNNISIIDPAQTPTGPISPNMLMNVVLALIVGIGIAVAVVFAREKLDDVIRSPEDIDRKLGLPFLSAIPIAEAGVTPMQALDDQRSNFSEAYFSLRTSLELSSASGLPKTLFFTSSRPSEGKSTTTIAVARAFGQVGKRTVLIDADLRKPTLHNQFGADNKVGLSNLLARQKGVDEALQTSPYPNLDFITCGPVPPNPAELLAGATFEQLLVTLSKRYDLVVIDGPPVLGLADAPTIASAAEATVFVIEANRSARGQTKTALRRLLATRARIQGAVLTKFDSKRIGYGSEYGYTYYYYGNQQASKPDGR